MGRNWRVEESGRGCHPRKQEETVSGHGAQEEALALGGRRASSVLGWDPSTQASGFYSRKYVQPPDGFCIPVV